MKVNGSMVEWKVWEVYITINFNYNSENKMNRNYGLSYEEITEIKSIHQEVQLIQANGKMINFTEKEQFIMNKSNKSKANLITLRFNYIFFIQKIF